MQINMFKLNRQTTCHGHCVGSDSFVNTKLQKNKVLCYKIYCKQLTSTFYFSQLFATKLSDPKVVWLLKRLSSWTAGLYDLFFDTKFIERNTEILA